MKSNVFLTHIYEIQNKFCAYNGLVRWKMSSSFVFLILKWRLSFSLFSGSVIRRSSFIGLAGQTLVELAHGLDSTVRAHIQVSMCNRNADSLDLFCKPGAACCGKLEAHSRMSPFTLNTGANKSGPRVLSSAPKNACLKRVSFRRPSLCHSQHCRGVWFPSGFTFTATTDPRLFEIPSLLRFRARSRRLATISNLWLLPPQTHTCSRFQNF